MERTGTSNLFANGDLLLPKIFTESPTTITGDLLLTLGVNTTTSADFNLYGNFVKRDLGLDLDLESLWSPLNIDKVVITKSHTALDASHEPH